LIGAGIPEHPRDPEFSYNQNGTAKSERRGKKKTGKGNKRRGQETRGNCEKDTKKGDPLLQL